MKNTTQIRITIEGKKELDRLMQLRIKEVFNNDPKKAAEILKTGFHYSDFVDELILSYKEQNNILNKSQTI